jgi:sulfopyruvate decarboxylase subunit beta
MNLRHEYLTALGRELNNEIIVTNTGGTQHELGLALALPNRKVIALDGDGSLLLNLGILPVLAQERPPNLLILVFDNGLYESGGNTPTLSGSGADLAAIARGAGIKQAEIIDSLEQFEENIPASLQRATFQFYVIRVKPGGLPITPKGMSGVENKFRFIRHIEATEGKRIFYTPVRTSQKPKD